MTQITFRKNNGHIMSVVSKDHSGYAEEGSDIVCAAISSLLISAANGLTDIVKVPGVKVQADEAYLRIEVPGYLSRERRRDADIILVTLFSGINEIAEAYPGNVRLKVLNEK